MQSGVITIHGPHMTLRLDIEFATSCGLQNNQKLGKNEFARLLRLKAAYDSKTKEVANV